MCSWQSGVLYAKIYHSAALDKLVCLVLNMGISLKLQGVESSID